MLRREDARHLINLVTMFLMQLSGTVAIRGAYHLSFYLASSIVWRLLFIVFFWIMVRLLRKTVTACPLTQE